MSEEELQELTESHYLRGQRSALIEQLHNVFRSLSIPYDNVDSAPKNLMTIASLIKERQEALQALRYVCDDYGDNDWEDDLHLADIINKHLSDHLYE